MISPEFLITAMVVVIIPGTGVIYTLMNGISLGKNAAVAAAFGCTIGIIPHLLAAILGLAAVLHTSAMLFQVVKFMGVMFLLYMAWKTLRDTSGFDVDADIPKHALPAIAIKGALINILNPKLSLFFLAFSPQFLSGVPAQVTGEMLLLGAIFMAMTFVVFVIYGLFASAARDRIFGNPRILAWMRAGFGVAFGGLALRLAVEDI